jgi:hypothetical protein
MAALLSDHGRNFNPILYLTREKQRSALICAGYFLLSACISRGATRRGGQSSQYINHLKGYLGLYLTKHNDIFLNGVKGFGEHLGLYLTGRKRHPPLFLLPTPILLIVRMNLSPRLDHIVPAKPIIRILSAKALVVIALPNFSAFRRARLLAHPDSSVRHKYPAAALTTLLSRHHHPFSLISLMASLY